MRLPVLRGRVSWLLRGAFGLCLVATLLPGATARADDGDLDPTWSGDGVVTFGVTGQSWRAYGIATQCDGKVVVVGMGEGAGENCKLMVARFEADGSLDESFNGFGILTLELAEYGATAWDVAVQDDGRIVVVGSVLFDSISGGRQVVVVRLNSDGTLDETFANGGLQLFKFGGDSQGHAVAVQGDGRIVVVGETVTATAIGVARLDTNGVLDTTFDGDGMVTIDFTMGDDKGWDVAVQPDGRILVAGTAAISGGSLAAVLRLLDDGSLDSSFGVGGGGAAAADFGVYSEGRALALQPDGRIVLAGFTDNQTAIAVARLTGAGSLDTTFSGDGMVTHDFVWGPDEGWDVALQGDGRIVVAGSAYIDGLHQVGVVRFTAGGAPDPELGGYGYALTSLGTDAFGRGVAIQPHDRKILVAGFVQTGASEAQLVVTRAIGDADLLFVDTFECGDVSGWSTFSGLAP